MARAAGAGSGPCPDTCRSASRRGAGRRRPGRPGRGRGRRCGRGPGPSATVASGRSTIGSVVIRPPAVRSSYDIRRRMSAASLGCIRLSSRSCSSVGSSPSRSAASSGSMASRTSAARSSFSLPRISIWSSSGSSSSTSASRSSSRAAATSARRLEDRWCRTLARSAGRSCSKVASRFSAPCPCSSREKPVTAVHSTVSASPLARRKALPFLPLRTKTRSISHSRRAGS